MPALFDPPLPDCVRQSIGSLNLFEILGTDCIGDTRVAINNNIRYLSTTICDLSSQRLVPNTTATIAHTLDSGSRVLTFNVQDNSITNAKLSAAAVTSDKIALSAVTADKINLVTSLAPNGYQIMPGGLIIQWGQSSAFITEESQDTTFPIEFPNACLQVIAGQIYPTDDTQTNAFIQTVSWDVSSVKMRAQSDELQPTSENPIYGNYIAIGH